MIAVVYQLSVLGPGPGALPELPLAAPITGSIRLSPPPAGAGAAAVVGPSSGPVLSSRHGESFAGKIYEESCRESWVGAGEKQPPETETRGERNFLL